jgi:hypothetical protein
MNKVEVPKTIKIGILSKLNFFLNFILHIFLLKNKLGFYIQPKLKQIVQK